MAARKAQYLTEQQVYGIAYRVAQDVAPTYGVDPVQLAKAATAIAYIESNYNINAKNKHSTARGIGQLLEKTQKWVEDKFVGEGNHPEKIWDPEYSLMLVEHYLGYQYNRYNNSWRKAISAYNQGSYKDTNKAGANYANKWQIALGAQTVPTGNFASNPANFSLEFL